MQRRHGFVLIGLLAIAWAGCSHGGERASKGSPTGPSAATAPPTSNPGQQNPVSHLLDVLFPPRNDSFDFRTRLEAKYRDQLQRGSTSTFVDLEGDVVWTQEYLRFRANGCDHITAVQKVFSEIDGGGLASVCSSTATPFPPRNEPLDFRRQLELKYQTQLKRSATATFVDIEGDIVWTQEYLRYRVSTCDHANAILKVFTQIDGGGIQPDCTPPPPPPPSCVYTVSPASQGVPVGGGSFTATLTNTSGSCTWIAAASASFITLTGATNGSTTAPVTYSVAANTGGARTGTINFAWSGGSTQVAISQDAAPPATMVAAFRMFDPGRQASETTECQFRSVTSSPTTCRLDGSISFPNGRNFIVSYAWTVQYNYVTVKTPTQTGSSPQFSFSDTCGQAGSDATGPAQPLSVTLTITDNNGSTATATAGAGNQPALVARLFTCGI